MNTYKRTTYGFSLVELAIVLAVIGLIVGGVLAGQDLIRSARLKTTIKQVESYVVAVRNFEDRYSALPGDMPNATDYWGEANATNCNRNAGAALSTCNGDANGYVTSWMHDPATLGAGGLADDQVEGFMFWEHLSNSGMIEGVYTGTFAGGGADYYRPEANTNVPSSDIKGVFYADAITNPAGGNAATHLYGTIEGNILMLGQVGAIGASSDFPSLFPVLTTDEAWSIDGKNDDSVPGYGKVQSPIQSSGFIDNGAGRECVTGDDEDTADYDLQADDIRCSLVFKIN